VRSSHNGLPKHHVPLKGLVGGVPLGVLWELFEF